MALLTSLITIVGTSNRAAGSTCSLLFLGTCRINDGITEELVLRHLLQELENNHSIRVSRISLRGFEIESLNEMMSAVLCLPRRKTLSLSQVVWEKTHGMPLFVVEVSIFVHTLLSCVFLIGF
jgi:ATP-dependent RNA helicase DDX31/DBP7